MAKLPTDASVIDPNDVRGLKNQYISQLRDRHILAAVGDDCQRKVALDLGCGNGGLTQAVVSMVPSVLGLDISDRLLYQASERSFSGKVSFAQYDGMSFPIVSRSLDFVFTYGVLIYLLDDIDLQRVLDECYRVLVTGGKALFVEQVGHQDCFINAEQKRRFSVDKLTRAFSDSGFRMNQSHVIRYGRFPLIVPIRLGLIPRSAFQFIAQSEAAIGKFWGVPRYSYCDVLFELEKAPEMQNGAP